MAFGLIQCVLSAPILCYKDFMCGTSHMKHHFAKLQQQQLQDAGITQTQGNAEMLDRYCVAPSCDGLQISHSSPNSSNTASLDVCIIFSSVIDSDLMFTRFCTHKPLVNQGANMKYLNVYTTPKQKLMDHFVIH